MTPEAVRRWGTAAVLALGAIGAGALALWQARAGAVGIDRRNPAESVRGGRHDKADAEAPETARIGERFERGPGRPGPAGASWPGFRGPERDNIAPRTIPLADRWPEGGPPRKWAVELGEGHAGAAIHGGRVYVLDYDESARADVLNCLSLEDGAVLWKRGYRVSIRRNHGMSRTVPAVADRIVVSLGPRGHLMAVDAEEGSFLWGQDLERDWGATIPLWYTAQCPLVDGATLVVAPGAPGALLAGLDVATGRILWKTPNPRGWKMSHSSVIPLTAAGRRMYVYAALGGVAGVSADPADAGRLLWECPDWSGRVVVPCPVPLGEDRLLLTAGYSAGGLLLRIVETQGRLEARVERRWGPREGLASEQQTPICHQGFLYAVLPKDAGPRREQLVCAPASDPLSFRWASGPEKRFGLGPFLVADEKLFVLADDGRLTLARATPEGYRELAEAKVLEGVDAWAPLALAEGHLLLRDSRRMVCLDVRRR